MPAKNPWLADSVYPTPHLNSAATDSVAHPGPTKGRKLTAAEVKTVPALYTSYLISAPDAHPTLTGWQLPAARPGGR